MLDALNLPSSLRAKPWLAWLVLIAATVFCLAKTLEIFWLTLAGPDLPSSSPPSLSALPAATQAQNAIAQWHLFGEAGGGVNLAALAQQKMQETQLKLTLRGTFNEDRPEGGIAIIADESGVDRYYRAGDSLPGEARLEQVLAGKVVLAHGGVKETLSLRLTDTGSGAAAPSRPASSPGPLPGSRTPSLMGSLSVTPAIAPGLPDMETYRATQLPNVQELAKQVQVFPVFANGRMRGVRLSVGRDSDILDKAGVKPGDIITSVNGIPLDSPTRQGELLSNLRDARQLQVEVERDGKTIKLQLGL